MLYFHVLWHFTSLEPHMRVAKVGLIVSSEPGHKCIDILLRLFDILKISRNINSVSLSK